MWANNSIWVSTFVWNLFHFLLLNLSTPSYLSLSLSRYVSFILNPSSSTQIRSEWDEAQQMHHGKLFSWITEFLQEGIILRKLKSGHSSWLWNKYFKLSSRWTIESGRWWFVGLAERQHTSNLTEHSCHYSISLSPTQRCYMKNIVRDWLESIMNNVEEQCVDGERHRFPLWFTSAKQYL